MENPSATFPSGLVPLVECTLLAVLVIVSTIRGGRSSRLPLSLLTSVAGRLRSDTKLVVLAGVIGFIGCALITAFYGFPVLGTDDAAAYLVMGETFASGQLVNPPAPHLALVPEQVLATPVYAGKYPPGQGLMLALGFGLGHPGIALMISAGLLAASMTWCVRGWLPRRWALLAAVLVLLRLAVGSYWNNSYWGGSVAAIGGALVFGGLGRHFCSSPQGGTVRNLPALAGGLAILAVTRPWEGFWVALPLLIWLVFWWWRRTVSNAAAGLRAGLPLALVGAATLVFLGYYNFRTTGSVTRFAHQQYEQDRPVAGEFVWQRWIRSEHRMSWVDVEVPAAERRGWWRQSALYLYKRAMKAGYFLLGPALLLAILLSLPRLWATRRYRLLVVSSLLVGGSHAIVHFYFPHYSAPMAAPLMILGLAALRNLSLRPPTWFRQGWALLGAALLIEVASFALQLPALRHHPGEYFMRQARITRQLQAQGGEHLILVNPKSAAVYNFQDLQAPVLWAADLGTDSTASLLTLFAGRRLWVFDPDTEPELAPLDLDNPTALGSGRVE